MISCRGDDRRGGESCGAATVETDGALNDEYDRRREGGTIVISLAWDEREGSGATGGGLSGEEESEDEGKKPNEK